MSFRNLLPFPEDFDNAAWSKTALTVTANATADPFGGTRADKLVEMAVSSLHETFQSSTTTPNTAVVWSIFAKAAERSKLLFAPFNATDGLPAAATIDLTTGALSGVTGTAGAINFGNGWWRLYVSGTPTVASNSLIVRMVDDLGATTYLGDVTKGLYVFGAEVMHGTLPAAYNWRPRVKSVVRPVFRRPTARRILRGRF